MGFSFPLHASFPWYHHASSKIVSTMSEASKVPVFDLQNLIDPYPMYKQLRDEAPVYHVPELNMYYVTSYELLRHVIRDTKTYSSQYDDFMAFSRDAGLANLADDVREEITNKMREMIPTPPTMLTLDEPDHTKYRSLVSQLFTGSEIKKSEADVQAVIDQHADNFQISDGEFMSGFGFPVPLEIISVRLGIPEADREFFYDAATCAASGLRIQQLANDEMLRRAQVAIDLQNLLVGLVEARREEPLNDMITILANRKLEEEDRLLTHGEILSILQQFLVAGHETTTSAFGWGMWLLCHNRHLQEKLRGNPEGIKVFVEEALRIRAPVQGLPRKVTEDTELGGVNIPAGSFIMLRYGAANMDEKQFPNPEVVDIERKKAGMQMAFGSGVHFCIGAPLARQELTLGFPALLERIENIRLNTDYKPAAEPSLILHNLPELHIEFDRRS